MNNYIKAKMIKELCFEFEEFEQGGRNSHEDDYIDFKLNIVLDYFSPYYYEGNDIKIFFRVDEEVHTNTGDCISKEEFIEEFEYCCLSTPSTSALVRALDERDEIDRIKSYLELDSTIEELMETGKVDPEFIPENLELLLTALEEVSGLEFKIEGGYISPVVEK